MPKEIYLQCDDGDYVHESTWCVDNISDGETEDTKYIRSDLQNKLECFYDYEGDLPNKLIALYSDGSGCELFAKKGKWHYPAKDCDFAYDGVDKDWFIDSGYLWFIALPDDFKVWSEDG